MGVVLIGSDDVNDCRTGVELNGTDVVNTCMQCKDPVSIHRCGVSGREGYTAYGTYLVAGAGAVAGASARWAGRQVGGANRRRGAGGTNVAQECVGVTMNYVECVGMQFPLPPSPTQMWRKTASHSLSRFGRRCGRPWRVGSHGRTGSLEWQMTRRKTILPSKVSFSPHPFHGCFYGSALPLCAR